MQCDEKLGTVISFISDQNVSWPSTSAPQNIEVVETHKNEEILFLPELMHQSGSSSSLLAMLEEQPVNPVSPCSSSKSVSPNPTKAKNINLNLLKLK